MENNSAAAISLRTLYELGGETDHVLEGFATAKRMLEARFLQYTSFLAQSPWNLVSLLEYLLPSVDTSSAMLRSRQRALKLLENHDQGMLGNTGDVGQRFFDSRGQHRRALDRWGRGIDNFMNQQLFRELVAYGSSLLVMQRLEAKHHLIHVPLVS